MRYLPGFLLGLLLFIGAASRDASADHNVFLPGLPTWLIQQIQADRMQVWCVDSRAANYPGFVDQLWDVNDRYAERVGIGHRLVAFDDPACRIKHTMPVGISCNGWAGRIWYQLAPVVVEYCAVLGYSDWRTVQGHELGHGLLGLHEQYRDSGGTIQCTGRQDTVMDCGSGVKYPTERDVYYGCQVLATWWCGQAWGIECNTSSGSWDPCTSRWYHDGGWSYDPQTQWWWNPHGVPEWTACNQDRLRWNLWLDAKADGAIDGSGGAWFPEGSGFFEPERGFWSYNRGC